MIRAARSSSLVITECTDRQTMTIDHSLWPTYTTDTHTDTVQCLVTITNTDTLPTCATAVSGSSPCTCPWLSVLNLQCPQAAVSSGYSVRRLQCPPRVCAQFASSSTISQALQLAVNDYQPVHWPTIVQLCQINRSHSAGWERLQSSSADQPQPLTLLCYYSVQYAVHPGVTPFLADR